VFQASLANRDGVAAISLKATEDAANPRIARLDTAWTTASPGQRNTLRLGDSLDQAGTWGRPVRFGGLQYGTDLDRGAAVVAPPAWWSARLIAARANWPHALPGVAGGEPAITQPSRTAFALTPPGMVDRACAVGFLRSNYGLDGDRYGPLFASATLRRGLSEDVTTELRGGAQEGVGNGGIAFVVRLKGLGTLSAATAASRGDTGTGRLAQTGFEYRRAGFSASIQSQWASSEFRQLGVADEGVPPRYWSVARASYDAARHGVFGLGYAALARHNEALSEAAEATYRVALGRVSSLTLSVSRRFAPEPGTSLMLVLTFPLDHLAARATPARAANGSWLFGRSPEPTTLARSPADEG
jgi:outer membrane usher protein